MFVTAFRNYLASVDVVSLFLDVAAYRLSGFLNDMTKNRYIGYVRKKENQFLSFSLV